MSRPIKHLREQGWVDLWRDPLTNKLCTLAHAMNIFRSRRGLPALEYKSMRSQLEGAGSYAVEWMEGRIVARGKSVAEALRKLADIMELMEMGNQAEAAPMEKRV